MTEVFEAKSTYQDTVFRNLTKESNMGVDRTRDA